MNHCKSLWKHNLHVLWTSSALLRTFCARILMYLIIHICSYIALLMFSNSRKMIKLDLNVLGLSKIVRIKISFLHKCVCWFYCVNRCSNVQEVSGETVRLLPSPQQHTIVTSPEPFLFGSHIYCLLLWDSFKILIL